MKLSNIRFNSKKNWKKVYIEKAEDIKETNQIHKDKYSIVDDANNVTSLDKASDFVLEVFDRKKAKEQVFRGRSSMYGTATLENLVPPKEFANWNLSWGQQVMCYMCGLPGISDCRVCDICDVIAHKQCIRYEQYRSRLSGLRNERNDGILSDDESLNDSLTDIEKTFICDNCKESKEIEIAYYNKVKAKLIEDRIKERSAQKIAKLMIIIIERKYLAKKKQSIVTIQSIARMYLAYKKYRKVLRGKIKMLIIQITRLPSMIMMEHEVVILTVFDPFKHTQTLRYDKTAEEALKEGFLIPGISAKMLIVINLAHMVENLEGRRHYYLYAQAQLSLKDVTEFTRKQTITLLFSEKIKWQPLLDGCRFHLVTHWNNNNNNNNSNINQQQQYLNTTNNVMMTSGDRIISSTVGVGGEGVGATIGQPTGGGGELNYYNNTTNMTSNTMAMINSSNSSSSPVQQHVSLLSGSATSSSSTGKLLFGLGTSIADRECVLNYLPQNPVLSIVGLIQGPPLDILKRPPDLNMKKKVPNNAATSSNYRNSRYWLCLYRLHLLLFQYYGDLSPRFVSDVSSAMAVLVRDNKGRKTAYVNIIQSDSRVWMLEFRSITDALRFEFALNESRRVSDNNSLFGTKTSYPLNEFQFGFSVQTSY